MGELTRENTGDKEAVLGKKKKRKRLIVLMVLTQGLSGGALEQDLCPLNNITSHTTERKGSPAEGKRQAEFSPALAPGCR